MSARPEVRRLIRGGAWAPVAALLWLTGCGVDTVRLPTAAAPAVVAPRNATPAEAVRLLEWSWNQRDLAHDRMLFTSDYQFVFSALDPYRNAYLQTPWTRDDELLSAEHLFRTGTVLEPPATAITLTFDRYPSVRDDPRPGKDHGWHKMIHTSLALVVIDPNKETAITGFATFFFVRGDSAAVPVNVPADSSHWFIDRWEDDTAAPPGGEQRAQPTSNLTVGALKVMYRADPAAAHAGQGSTMLQRTSRAVRDGSRRPVL